MGLALRDAAHHTFRDYLGWHDGQRWELVDGTAYAMSPAPTRLHQHFVGEIFFQLRRALDGKPCLAYLSPIDVRLPKHAEADDDVDDVVQPDVLVVCDRAKLDERGVRGAPDLVVEVLSAATAAHDIIRKRRLYERAGVREFWLVHPVDRLVTVYRLQPDGYGKPDIQALEGTTAVGVLAGVAIEWDPVVATLAPQPE